MISFVDHIAQLILRDYADDLDRLTIIFPNRRAGLFLQHALGNYTQKPIWMPGIQSLEDYILRQSSLEKIETLEAVFQLYEVYKSHQQADESFDRFFFWGEMILRDFEEIDHYKVDPDHLFKSIKSQKELDEAFYFLTEEERHLIESFWHTFLPESTRTQEAFLETWKLLGPIYHGFRKQLQQTQKGYLSMIYQEFLEGLKSGKVISEGPLLLAGFNALTAVEEEILKCLVRDHGARMLWDADKYYLDDPVQEAGYFLRLYQKDTLLGKSFDEQLVDGIKEDKVITATGVSLEVGQAKAMAEDLARIATQPNFVPERTVIVLPQEYMLFPVLSSLPDAISEVNITMGFPMKDTLIFSLLENILLLQHTKRTHLVHGYSYYHKYVIDVLLHPALRPLDQSTATEFVNEIRKRNLIYVYQEDLPSNSVLELIFSQPEAPLTYLMQILERLHAVWKEEDESLEVEFIARFHQQIEQLDQMIGERALQLSYDFLLKLFRRVARSLKIPFGGEPLNGVQIMGILETRNLDFDHVFILNMNEDAWPAPPRKGSFVPYNIRRAFELPVYEHQDAIYAYLFYRLLQRSKHVHLYYNTVSEFNVNGEISRLVQQLEVESGLKIQHKILANPIEVKPMREISINKDARVMASLAKFTTTYGGKIKRRLTPSALDTYMQCRLRFYFRYVEELYEPDELKEEMDPMVFGNILHDSMEILYEQFMKTQKRDVIDAGDFFWLKGGIEGAINKAFIKHYAVKNEKKFKLEGRNIIAADIIRKTIDKILDFDQAYAPFRILGLEASTREGYTVDLPVEVGDKQFTIALKGKIDRIDLKEGRIRVIDYKTGKDSKTFTSISSFIDRDDKDRNKAAFQVFFYSYLVKKTFSGSDYSRIEPGLFNSRDLFKTDFAWQLTHKINSRTKETIQDFQPYASEFEGTLSNLLAEIWDESVPFNQVEDEKKCQWCAYKEICGRIT